MTAISDPPPEWKPGKTSVDKFELLMSDLSAVQFIRRAVLTEGGPILPKIGTLEIAPGWELTYTENLITDAIDVKWERS